MKIAAILSFLKNNLKLIIIIASLVVCATVGTVVTVSVVNSPENVMRGAIAEVFDSTLKRDDIKYLDNVFNEGSIEYSFDSFKEEGDKSKSDSYARGKLYFGGEAIMLTDIDMDLDGTTFEGELYASEDLFYLYEKNQLDGAYGFRLSTLADDLADSIFSPYNNTKYSIDKETYNTITDLLDSINENKSISKDAERLCNKIIKKLWEIFTKYAEFEVEYDNIRIEGKKEAVRIITVKLSPDALADAICDSYDYLCDSDEIYSFLDKYDEAIRFMLSDSFDDEKYDSISEMYEDVLSSAEEGIDEFCDNLYDSLKKYDDDEDNPYNSEIVLTTPKRSSTLIELNVKLGATSDLYINTNSKGGIKDSKELTIRIGTLTYNYEVLWDNNYYHQAQITLKSTDKSEPMDLTVKIDIDKELETYTINITSKESGTKRINYDGWQRNVAFTETNSMSISGTYSTDKDITKATVDEILIVEKAKYDSAAIPDTSNKQKYILECELVINPKDKMPSSRNDFTSIADITEEQIEALVKPFETE